MEAITKLRKQRQRQGYSGEIDVEGELAALEGNRRHGGANSKGKMGGKVKAAQQQIQGQGDRGGAMVAADGCALWVGWLAAVAKVGAVAFEQRRGRWS